MGIENWSLIGKLKRAVKKITFLLNFDLQRWKLATYIISSRKRHHHHQLSFNEKILQRQPTGLSVICHEDEDEEDDMAKNAKYESSTSSRNSFKGIQRTMSYPSSEDDIDKRAEMFIANFYNQLRLERQISLELRYCRGNSFGSSPSP